MAHPWLNWLIRLVFVVISATFFILYLQEPDPEKANLYFLIFIIVLVVEILSYFIYYYLLARRRQS